MFYFYFELVWLELPATARFSVSAHWKKHLSLGLAALFENDSCLLPDTSTTDINRDSNITEY